MARARKQIGLATRLTAFSLGALALVLVGFSSALYLAARWSLSREADARLESALVALVAAVEFNDRGLEWEPAERVLALGRGPGPGEVRWAVHDGSGALLDRSANFGEARLRSVGRLPGPDRPGTLALPRVALDGRAWRVARRRIEDQARPRRRPPRHYPALVLTAAVSLEPADAALGKLGRLLAGLSAGVWLTAAALGRSACRRALGPLTRMAQAARGMKATEPGGRLPRPGTGDELDDLADAFNGVLDRLHEAFERQTRFTGDASHQLRTPLAVMLGQAEVALRRDRPAEDYRRALASVRDQASHLGGIVEMLLFLARADAEAELPGLRVVDLDAWARGHLGGWSGSAHSRAGDLTFARTDGRDGPLPARVHAPLLGQLVDNLVDNALKASEPGTPVVLGLGGENGGGGNGDGDGGVVALSVRDRGRGVAADDLAHVFDAFFRSLRARAEGRPGVGLGLTVAQRIASALDGRITAESEPGRGSVFTLRLPRAGVEVEPSGPDPP